VVSREEGGHSGCSSREKLREEKSRSQSRGYKPRGPVNQVCVECGKVFLGRPAEEAHLLKALHRRPLSAAASVQGSGGGGSQAAAAAEAEARAAQLLGLRPRSFSTSRWPFAERPQQGSRLTLPGRPTDFAETASLELTGVSDETLAVHVQADSACPDALSAVAFGGCGWLSDHDSELATSTSASIAFLRDFGSDEDA
jgi:hypothetical protein